MKLALRRRRAARQFRCDSDESGMSAFIWNTNHRMWKVVPPFTDSSTC